MRYERRMIMSRCRPTRSAPSLELIVVRAAWYPASTSADAGVSAADGGDLSYDSSNRIDEVRTCQKVVLKDSEAAKFVMTSNVVIPSASVIRVIVETTGLMTEDSQRIIASP